MLTDRNLQELLDFKTEHPVLTIYLNTDPALGSADVYKTKLRSMLKEVDLPEDVENIERYFDHEYDWSGRSVALFSCASEDFFRAYPIAVVIRSRVITSNRPYVKPLADAFDSFGGYGVALVDKQGARLFSFHLGELREQEGVVGEDVRRVKHGGGSQAVGRRGGESGQTQHTEEVTDRNMREAAGFAAQFFSENNIRRVLLGGTDDNISAFRQNLPKSWQSLIVGTFPISMAASNADVFERAMKIGKTAEQQREKKLVEALVTSAAKGRGGVTNLNETLRALHEGRIQTLLISEGFRAPGYRCSSCDYMTAYEEKKCPFCNGTFEKIPDAVELTVRRVMRGGGEVEVLHDTGTLKEHGNIGALLRY